MPHPIIAFMKALSSSPFLSFKLLICFRLASKTPCRQKRLHVTQSELHLSLLVQKCNLWLRFRNCTFLHCCSASSFWPCPVSDCLEIIATYVRSSHGKLAEQLIQTGEGTQGILARQSIILRILGDLSFKNPALRPEAAGV